MKTDSQGRGSSSARGGGPKKRGGSSSRARGEIGLVRVGGWLRNEF